MAQQPNDRADMYNLYDSKDSNEEKSHHDEEMNQTPVDSDPTRPPQLNLGNTSCHCNCGCLCYSNDDDGDGHTQAVLSVLDSICNGNSGAHYASSDPGDNEINGQEGDEHMIEAGDLGPISCRTVIRALARQRRCTCAVESEHTPIDSGMMSPADSMHVDPSSSQDLSMASSQVLSIPSRSSSVLFGAGEMFMHDAILERLPVLYQPLRLTPEAPVVPFEYPMTLSNSAGEIEVGIGRDYDIW